MKINLNLLPTKISKSIDEGTIGTFDYNTKNIDIFLFKFYNKKKEFNFDSFLTEFTNTTTHEVLHYLVDRNTKRKQSDMSHIGEEGFVRHIVDDVTLKDIYFHMACYHRMKCRYELLIKFDDLRWKLIKKIIFIYSIAIIGLVIFNFIKMFYL